MAARTVSSSMGVAINGATASKRLINTATNITPGLAEVATIHSTVYSPRVPIGDGLRSIDIYRNTV